jgi:hypothetical protein
MAMMKHMAAAVLYAVIGLLGPMDPAVGGTDGDGDVDDDAGVECVSFVPKPGRAGSSLVLSAASRLCGEQIDGAWVVNHHHRPAAAAAVHQTPDFVAMIDLASGPGAAADGAGNFVDENSTLLTAALDRCREQDALKVVVHVQGVEVDVVRHLAEARGYRFSRISTESDATEIEFYTDLYWSDAHVLG